MIGDKIKELRLAKGLTQIKLAERLDVTKGCVSNWENGYIEPSLAQLRKLLDFFHVEADYLLEISSERTLDTSYLSNQQIEALQEFIDTLANENE